MNLTYTRKNGATFEFDPDSQEELLTVADLMQEDEFFQGELVLYRAKMDEILSEEPPEGLSSLQLHRFKMRQLLQSEALDKKIRKRLVNHVRQVRRTGMPLHILGAKRGFVDKAALTNPNGKQMSQFLRGSAAGQFVSVLRLHEVSSESLTDLLQHAGEIGVFDQIDRLDLLSVPSVDAELIIKFAGSFFPNLRSLDLSYSEISDKDLIVLVESKELPNLCELILDRNEVTREGLCTLIEQGKIFNFKKLDLRTNSTLRESDPEIEILRKEGVEVVLSPHFNYDYES